MFRHAAGLADQRQSGGGWRHHSRHTRRVVLPREAEGALVVEAHAVLAQGIVEVISLLVVPLKLLAAQLVQQTLLSVGGGGLQAGGDGRGLGGRSEEGMVRGAFLAGGDTLLEGVLHGEEAVDELLLAAGDAHAVGLAEGAEGGKRLAGKFVGSGGRGRLEGGGETRGDVRRFES